MRQLEPLNAWQDWLSWFGVKLQTPVDVMLQNLSPLLEAPRPLEQGFLNTSQGLETILRRGHYEHLMLSEWLLASELPDEFLRRAANHEHLFFAPLPHEREGGKRILALFDCGPEQLGAPRLAHLALMILLARRADMVGGEMKWAVLQDPGAWRTLGQVAELKSFLGCRSWHLADQVCLDSWKDHLKDPELAQEELWLICADGSLPSRNIAGIATHILTLHEDVRGDRLHVRLQAPQSVSLKVELFLPLPAIGERLLKGTFADDVLKAAKTFYSSADISFLAPILISQSGSRIIIRSRKETLFNFVTAKAKAKNPVVQMGLPENGKLVTAGFLGSKYCVLYCRYGQYRLWSAYGGFSQAKLAHCDDLKIPAIQEACIPSFWLKRMTGEHRLIILDHQRQLRSWSISSNDDVSKMEILAPNVLNAAYVSIEAIAYLHEENGQYKISVINPFSGSSQTDALGAIEEVKKSFIVGGNLWLHRFNGCALQIGRTEDARWRLYNSGKHAAFEVGEVVLPAQLKVIGCLRLHREQLTLVLWDRKQKISAFCDGIIEHWFTAPDPLARVDICSQTGRIAMLSLRYELSFFDPTQKKLLFSITFKKTEDAF